MPKYFSSFRFDLLLFLVLLLTSKLHCSLESLDKELCQVHQRKEWGSETKKRERVKVSPSFSLLQSTKKQVIDLILLLSSWETREVSFIVVVVSILRLLQLLFSLKYSLLQPISRLEKRNAGTTWIEAEGMSLSLLKMRQPRQQLVSKEECMRAKMETAKGCWCTCCCTFFIKSYSLPPQIISCVWSRYTRLCSHAM